MHQLLLMLKSEIETRIFEVEKIIEHTQSQLPSQERVSSAVHRIIESKRLNTKE